MGGQDILPSPSEREMIADATISNGADEVNRTRNRYTGIMGGWERPHQTAHMAPRGGLPAGGNIAFLDSHVEWRRFDRMVVRNTIDPSFWW